MTDRQKAEGENDRKQNDRMTEQQKDRKMERQKTERQKTLIHYLHFFQELYRYFRLSNSILGLNSMFFLTIVIFLYLTLPELKNLSGRLFSANLFCILATTFLLTVSYNVKVDSIYRSGSDEFFFSIPQVFCKGLGYTLYFSGVSMFVWTSLLCFDLTRTFTNMRLPKRTQTGNDQTGKRHLL
jgi:hypothetical protein